MKCEIHLCGELEDFEPKFDKLKPEDYDWIMDFPSPKGQKHFKMNLEEVIRFLKMFNEVEEIFFEVR